MEYVVTNHAIERFMEWKRTGCQKTTEKSARKKLIEIAQKGRHVGNRPNNASEVEYQKLFAVISKEGNRTIIITFNGDTVWRNWFRKQKYGSRVYKQTRHRCKTAAVC